MSKTEKTTSFEEFSSVLREHEIKTLSKFVCVRSDKAFTEAKFTPTKNMKLHWNGDIPHYYIGCRVYACHKGKDMNLSKKKRYAEKRDLKACKDHVFIKRRNLAQPTKKVDCPVYIYVSRVLALPRFKLSKLTKFEKTKMSEIIKQKVEDGKDIAGENVYSFNLPDETDHQNHITGLTAAVMETIDPTETIDPKASAKTSVKGLLLDITGVLYESGTKYAINGSIESIKKLRDHKIPFRFVTNESTATRSALVKKLQSFGFKLSEEEIFCPGIAASQYIQENKLKPYLLVHPDILAEFSKCDQSFPNCVVVGDAGDNFTYKNMNQAFSILMEAENPILISLGKGKYYRDQDQLVMDLGGFTAALEYATGVTAKIIGKPSSDYFYSAAKSLQLKPEEMAMVGDDISSDVCASKNCGFFGVLVRTGKFREKDLEASSIKPDAVVDNLAQYVDMLCC